MVGIVVDDAIVTGENIYSKVKAGVPPLQAAVEGSHEVATPVTFGALTTMVAFVPLMFFEGTWGDFAKQIPPVVAPVLLFSLVESKLILPSHLKHLQIPTRPNMFVRFQSRIADGLESFVEHVYPADAQLVSRESSNRIVSLRCDGTRNGRILRGWPNGFCFISDCRSATNYDNSRSAGQHATGDNRKIHGANLQGRGTT